MRNKVLQVVIIILWGCVACTDDDNVKNMNSFNMLRFDFPQGNNPWDKEIEQIAQEWGMYIIYKNVDSTDLNRTWTSSYDTSIPIYVCDEPTDKEIQLYLELIKEWLLGSLDKTNEEHLKQLPLY